LNVDPPNRITYGLGTGLYSKRSGKRRSRFGDSTLGVGESKKAKRRSKRDEEASVKDFLKPQAQKRKIVDLFMRKEHNDMSSHNNMNQVSFNGSQNFLL
jgi:hypothetical protein